MIRIGIDVGGTFTDVTAVDDAGHVFTAKVPSTPADQSLGVVAGIRRILADRGLSPADVRAVAHGTTVATNTLLERKGAATALITTPGFRDVLHIGRQNRPQLYDLRARRQEPLVPRHWRREVPERTLHTGAILVHLDEADLQATIRELLAEGVESIAICFLHASANPQNEQLALAAARASASVPVSISSAIVSEFREFERMSTTVLNAYVEPVLARYVSRLTGRVAELGIGEGVTVMQSSGGMMTADEAASRAVYTLLSGPAGGVLAGQYIAQLTGEHNLITADVGGTSFDVSVIEHGEIAVRSEGAIEGYAVKFPHIDIHTIGAGGGSVAWIDAGGALRMGPRSAGALPGPVCYSRGGSEPTVTDAHAVLGRLGTALLAGELPLDVAAARTAIAARVAGPLGMTVEAAAEGMLRVANAAMARAIRVMTVQRGIDPRRFALLPFGGAGPLHGVDLARELGVPRMLVPVDPGNLSAFGLLAAPLRYDEVRTHLVRQDRVDLAAVAVILAELEAAGRARAGRGSAEAPIVVQRRADLRTVGQAYELTVTLPADVPLDAATWADVVAAFHRQHERSYGFARPENPVELVNLRVTVLRSLGSLAVAAPSGEAAAAQALAPARTVRPAYFGGDWVATPLYWRGDLRPGHRLTGPAVVEEMGATTVLGPGDCATVDDWRNLIVTVAPARGAAAPAAATIQQAGR